MIPSGASVPPDLDDADGASDVHPSPGVPLPQALAWVLALHFCLAWLSIELSRGARDVAGVWWANAPVVALLLFQPRAHWPALLAAAGVANVGANLLSGSPVLLSLAFVPGNLLELALGAWLLDRAGFLQAPLRSPQRLLGLLLLGGLLPQLPGAAMAALVLSTVSADHYELLLVTWLQGSVIGAVSLLPLSFLVASQPAGLWRRRLRGLDEWAWAVLACGVSFLALALHPYPWVLVALPVVLAAIWIDLFGVSAITAAVSLLVASALSTQVFVPIPVTSRWELLYVSIAWVAALLPGQLLAAAMTQMRDSRDRLAQRRLELRRSNEQLEQFVRVMSHDLREPINTVNQFGALLREDLSPSLPSGSLRQLDLIVKAGQRMRALLDDLLTMSRLQAQARPVLQPVALDTVLVGICESLAARIEARGARVSIGPMPSVLAHEALLSLLLQNLMSNALKFVPAERTPTVSVQAVREGVSVFVTVEDNGTGIADGDRAKLFQPFVRLHLRREFEGTGLGLALSQRIAAQLDGEITVASTLGVGSRFTVRLRAAD